MTSMTPAIDPLSAQLPRFSADWRFLLPLRPRARLLVAGSGNESFTTSFSGLDVIVVSLRPARLSSTGDSKVSTASADNSVIFDLMHPPFAPNTFDILAMPYGIPADIRQLMDSSRVSMLDTILKPTATLLIGVTNRWNLWRRSKPGPYEMGRKGLHRFLNAAGFSISREYAAFPELARPAYIMPLTRQAISFFLGHRYSGPRTRPLSRILSIPLLSGIFSSFMPGYFLVAGREQA